jgi:uncharacterized protein (DUF1330 family)
MPKAYWVAHIDVEDAEAYKKYVNANAAPLQAFGGRFLVRGGRQDVLEGEARKRTVVIEFKDLETARACYESVAYQTAKELREMASHGDLVIVEGYDE